MTPYMPSPDTELVPSYEATILDLHQQTAELLDDLRERVQATARVGADLGDHVAQYRASAKIGTEEQLWNRLRELSPAVREDVMRFAFRAAHARKHGKLEDPSQLTFALAAPDAPHDSPRPQSHEANEVLALTSSLLKVTGFLRAWQDKQPIKRWPEKTRQSVKATLKPLMELYSQL